MTVHSTTVVQQIFGANQEYGGFERPEWLDQRVESAGAPAEVQKSYLKTGIGR